MRNILLLLMTFLGVGYSFGQSDDSFQINSVSYKVVSKTLLTRSCYEVIGRDINSAKSKDELFYSNSKGDYLNIPLKESVIKSVIQKGNTSSINGVKKRTMDGYTLDYIESGSKRVYIAPDGNGEVTFIVLPIEYDFLEKRKLPVEIERQYCELDCIDKYDGSKCKNLKCKAEKSWKFIACMNICLNKYPTRVQDAFQSISFEIEPVKRK